MQLTASSADGSVYGKKSERNRVRDRLVVEEPAHERLDRAEQVGQRDVAVDGEAFDLVEHGRVAGVQRLVAVRAPGRDDVDRRLVRLHRADLHRRRMGPQHHLLVGAQLEVERVLHRAGRVRRRDVQCLEVVPVVLDLGPLGDPVPEPDEDVLELALDLRDEVQVPPVASVGTRGQVEAVTLGRRRGLDTGERRRAGPPRDPRPRTGTRRWPGPRGGARRRRSP